MAGTCGFKWYAKLLEAPPSTKVTGVEQICVEPKGHKDDHRSSGNVTAPNSKEGGE